MSAMATNFIEFGDRTPLDALIEQLVAVRDSLPAGAEAEMRLQDCEATGRRLSIAYARPLPVEESHYEDRFSRAYREFRERELLRLQKEVGVVRDAPGGSERTLRIVD